MKTICWSHLAPYISLFTNGHEIKIWILHVNLNIVHFSTIIAQTVTHPIHLHLKNLPFVYYFTTYFFTCFHHRNYTIITHLSQKPSVI